VLPELVDQAVQSAAEGGCDRVRECWAAGTLMVPPSPAAARRVTLTRDGGEGRVMLQLCPSGVTYLDELAKAGSN
jgi:hypothetical protein